MRKYGHLRPGSYDILSPRYADRANLFAGGERLVAREELPGFELAGAEKKDLGLLINEYGLATNPDALLEYARRAIPL